MANSLLVAECRSVPILTGSDPAQETGTRILALARAHALSSNDATYLELAQRLGATLASFDRQLQQAATAIGISLIAASAP